MFEIVQTKLVHYVLPTFPAIAFLTADAIVRCIRGQHDDLKRPIAVLVTGIWAGAIMLIGMVPWLGAVYLRPLEKILYVAMGTITGLGIIYASIVFVLFRAQRFRAAFAAMGAGMAIIIAVFYLLYLPNARFLWLPRQVADCLIAHGATTKGEVFMIDYKEDSLPYYQGGTIREFPQESFIYAKLDGLPEWVVMTRDLWRQMPVDVHKSYFQVDAFSGIAYAARGRIVEVVVLRRRW
jgi:4-amino-4-deoxy-L-arabinose transferase-like glycosyltransferase